MPTPRKPVEYIGPMPVDLSEIDDGLRPASEMRVSLDPDAIREYAGILSEMPPVKLMWDGEEGKYWAVDGAHTLTAFAGTGQQTVPAMVADGDYMAAFEAAARENRRRGLRITHADKRARVEWACRELPARVDDWPWAAKRLGDFCGVSDHLAGDVLENSRSSARLDPAAPRSRSNGRPYPPTLSARPSDGQCRENEIEIRPLAARPSPYEGLRACLDNIQVLIASVNAPDDDVQKGWGGFPAVFARMSRWERKSVRNSLRHLIESLQEWQLDTGVGADGPDRGEEA